MNGDSLEPLPPNDAKAPGSRYLHIHEAEALDEPLLEDWIRQAAALPGQPLF